MLTVLHLAHAQCSTSGIGFSLEGFTYASTTAPDVHTCYSACKLQEPTCRSINYHVNTSLCQLNNHSRLSRPAGYVASPLSLYFHSDKRGKQHPAVVRSNRLGGGGGMKDRWSMGGGGGRVGDGGSTRGVVG